MSDYIHINIIWAREKVKTILLSQKKVKLALACGGALMCAGIISPFVSTKLVVENSNLNTQVADMNLKLIETSLRVDDLVTQNSALSASFAAEKDNLLNKTLMEFDERNQLIEDIMKNIGVKINKLPPTANSGGPYLPPSEDLQEELLLQTDKNLDILRRTPLGRPVSGSVSSHFGHRIDPINGKHGFHSGVDMQASYGEQIKATADGIVIQANHNGYYGNFVEIKHGNGFTTSFAHLQEYKVKEGDSVKRGQVIGLAGNSGRSTGVHLHYELCLNGRPVNPKPFMQTASLSKE
jgi:murein DD-endopeptidase MepM/ murein hydrolase activator NlpD